MTRIRRLLTIPLGVAVLFPAAAAAQSAWALTNARIETVTRGTIERGTIVIRDGVIEAVGATITPPADARVIDLSGRTVYPGLIDLTSTLGLPAAPQQQGGGFDFFGGGADTSGRPIGLEPNRLVANELRLSLADVRTARDVGLTSVLVSPNRGLYRGLSALVPLRDDTATRWIVKAPVALHVGYETVRGQYPASLLGVIAYQRQSLYDAQRHAMLMERQRTNPRGMTRPSYDADLDALVPVVKGEIPMFIAANQENEIRRAVALAKEFGVKVTVVGATEAFRAIDALKGARPPVISVNFPEHQNVTGWQYRGALRREMDDSAKRAAAVRAKVEGNAAALHQAGIRFALASGGLRPAEFVTNVKKAVAAGLPREVAIEAMTIRAAEAAGVEQQLGSIEVGKIGNFVITEGDLLADTGKIRTVVVDGQRYDVVPATETRSAGGRVGRGTSTSPEGHR